MTTTYYAPPDHFQGNVVVLPSEEALHATKVLRKSVGDDVIVVDGVGGWHRVILKSLHKDKVLGEVVERLEGVGEPDIQVTVGLALLKNANRFEDFAEKAVEMGVYAIQPLLTHRTEVQKFKADRLQRILIAAMKQCGRSRLPVLHEPIKLTEALKPNGATSILCHEQIALENSLWHILKPTENNKVRIFVGPEGGFTKEEVELAHDLDWHGVSLGKRRLRAETAAMVAASMVLQWES